MQYTTILESEGLQCIRLVKANNVNRYTVVLVDYDKGQVYDAMPNDGPTDGGKWCAKICDRGIDYVASLYSESYARRIYSSLTL